MSQKNSWKQIQKLQQNPGSQGHSELSECYSAALMLETKQEIAKDARHQRQHFISKLHFTFKRHAVTKRWKKGEKGKVVRKK